MTVSEKAKLLFESGYTCAQAVFLAFNDITGLDNLTAAKIVSGFGGGFGRMREVCGAACGMTAVISYMNSNGVPGDFENKKMLYEKIQKAMKEYKEINGSYICRELLGNKVSDSPVPTQRTPDFYKKRPCSNLCASAAEIAEKYI